LECCIIGNNNSNHTDITVTKVDVAPCLIGVYYGGEKGILQKDKNTIINVKNSLKERTRGWRGTGIPKSWL
jgi:hypothetical protein